MLLQMSLAGTGPAWAAGSEPLDKWQAVHDRELDSMRGGYTSSGGMEISFGIETAVFVDGLLQAVTTFNSVVSSVDTAGSQVVVQNADLISPSGVPMVQSGLSSMDAEAIRSQLFTVIQNDQDHKIIDTITRIDATVSSLNLYRQNNFISSLQQQLIDAR